MTALTIPAPTRRTSVASRIGVVLAVLQGLAAFVTNIAWWSADAFSIVVSVVGITGGALAVALAVPAWRGVRWAAVVIGIALLVASLGGVPAFLFPGVPAVWVIIAAGGIVLAVVTLILLLLPARR